MNYGLNSWHGVCLTLPYFTYTYKPIRNKKDQDPWDINDGNNTKESSKKYWRVGVTNMFELPLNEKVINYII